MRYVSRDGLCSSNDQAAVATWDSIGTRMAERCTAETARLRALGVKAAHPDDGWVDRDASTVQLVYPQFDDGVQVGNVIALGWPWEGYRLVLCTRIERRRGPLLNTVRYHFVPIRLDGAT